MTGQDLFNLLTETGLDGVPLFSNAEVRHVLPLIAVQMPMDGLSDGMKRLVAQMLADAGVMPGQSTSEVWDKIEAHYQRSPLNARLASALGRLFAGARTGAPVSVSVAKLIGAVPPTKLVPRHPPQAGAVASGPLARFALNNPNR